MTTAEKFAIEPPVVSSPCESGRELEQLAQPPRDVLLDLHHRRARLPQPDVAVEPLREELAERGGVQAAAGDVREVAGAAVLERVPRRGVQRVSSSASNPTSPPSPGGPAIGGQLEAAPRRCSAGASSRPSINVDQVLDGGSPHRAHVLGERVERQHRHMVAGARGPPRASPRHAASAVGGVTASSSRVEASAISSTAAVNASVFSPARLAEAAHLADVLQRGCADLLVGRRLVGSPQAS